MWRGLRQRMEAVRALCLRRSAPRSVAVHSCCRAAQVLDALSVEFLLGGGGRGGLSRVPYKQWISN